MSTAQEIAWAAAIRCDVDGVDAAMSRGGVNLNAAKGGVYLFESLVFARKFHVVRFLVSRDYMSVHGILDRLSAADRQSRCMSKPVIAYLLEQGDKFRRRCPAADVYLARIAATCPVLATDMFKGGWAPDSPAALRVMLEAGGEVAALAIANKPRPGPRN